MGRKPLIVAIDDEIDYTSMVEEYFQLRGYEIFVANEGAKGINLIKEKKPDVIILDLRMPGINGENVMAVAKDINPKVKIIFVTAYDDGGVTKNRILELGAYAYLDKPLPSIANLEDTVKAAFGEG